MIVIRDITGVNPICNINMRHFNAVKKHVTESFLQKRKDWNPEIEGHAAYFEQKDKADMFPCGEGEYEWLDPTIWEEVKLLEGGIYAIYVVVNNSNCSVAYVPNEEWVPNEIKEMLKAFIV